MRVQNCVHETIMITSQFMIYQLRDMWYFVGLLCLDVTADALYQTSDQCQNLPSGSGITFLGLTTN